MGESKIIGPDGLDIAIAGNTEKTIIGEINSSDISLIRNKLPYLEDSKALN